MASASKTTCLCKTRAINKSSNELLKVEAFLEWYQIMIDEKRNNIVNYLSDDVTLEWYGRTIETKEKVVSYLKFDMDETTHYVTVTEIIDKFLTRQERLERINSSLANRIHSSEPKVADSSGMRRRLRSNCKSPEWAEGCGPDNEYEKIKKFKKASPVPLPIIKQIYEVCECSEDALEINDQGDGLRRKSIKCVQVTPPNKEVGQGDCMPSISDIGSNKSHDALYAQLPKVAIVCEGYLVLNKGTKGKFTKECKLEISYSEDPFNVGEYIIWALRYTYENKAARDLRHLYEEQAEELRKSLEIK